MKDKGWPGRMLALIQETGGINTSIHSMTKYESDLPPIQPVARFALKCEIRLQRVSPKRKWCLWE